ncbi:MAG TPA: MauE/DoxX family redox-associated membrane protein [Smithellaceae bacterium]|nr:MauE/DoxX family redox-associated membrane protein [Smithellaceae bacterium]HRV45512.1 MauE/DoxX family redox-associated membrane protein [Smithellaceae bacterium]
MNDNNALESIKVLFHKLLVNPWPYRIVRFALAALFIYGGVVKLFDPKAFAATISTYDLVPEVLLPVVAIGLPIIETIAGIALLFDRIWGHHLITALLIMFVFVLGYGVLGDLNVDCGCFGAEELDKQAGLRAAFYRDLMLIGIVMPYLYVARWFATKAGERK